MGRIKPAKPSASRFALGLLTGGMIKKVGMDLKCADTESKSLVQEEQEQQWAEIKNSLSELLREYLYQSNVWPDIAKVPKCWSTLLKFLITVATLDF